MNEPEDTKSCPAQRDSIASLRLSAEDLQALARQGFVSREYRQQLGRFFKLRWRTDGQQKVRYLGQDPCRAEAIRTLLDQLQEPGKIHRQLVVLLREARGWTSPRMVSAQKRV